LHPHFTSHKPRTLTNTCLIPKRRKRKQRLWVKDGDDDRFSREKGEQNFLQTLVRESEEDRVKKNWTKVLK
jgi:hypothetical protein